MTGRLTRTGITTLGAIPWGAHVCLFYETKQDLLDAHVAYFKAGLQDNEFCMWAVSEPITEREARDELARNIPNFEQYLAERRIEILSGREWYLQQEKVDLQRIVGGWHRRLEDALDRNFAGIRVSGKAFWLATDHYWTKFMEYERELDRTLAGQRVLALCTYPLEASRALDVLDVIRAHDVTVARRQGDWEVLESYVPAVEETERSPPGNLKS